MILSLRDPLVLTWLLLSLATLVSWWLGSTSGSALWVLLIAVVKCRFVIWNYMEVRTAPRWLRFTCDAWLVLTFAMTSSFYWFVVGA